MIMATVGGRNTQQGKN